MKPAPRSASTSLGALGLLTLALVPLGCEPKPGPEAGPAAEARAPAFCAGGAVKDDGSVETGYGFVPSATFGEYVQELSAAELPSRRMSRVCVCWLKTRAGADAEFEVVFYADAGGRPAEEPFAAVAGSAEGIPQSVEAAGRLWEVDVSEVTLPAGAVWVGARWNPSAARFLFLCADQSEDTPAAQVFFREDRGPRWQSVSTSRDPIFRSHRAVMVRAEGR